MFYDPESNIISIELSNLPISNAREFSNFIIHFSPAGRPVLIEILDADKLVKQFDKIKDLKKIEETATSML